MTLLPILTYLIDFVTFNFNFYLIHNTQCINVDLYYLCICHQIGSAQKWAARDFKCLLEFEFELNVILLHIKNYNQSRKNV